MNSLTCDLCGGNLQMDPGGRTATCQFCGMQYSVERLKEKIQEIKGTISIEGTVNVSGIASVDSLLLRAREYKDLGNRDRAIEYYNRVLDIDPTNREARGGLQDVAQPDIMEWSGPVRYEVICDCGESILIDESDILDAGGRLDINCPECGQKITLDMDRL